MRVLEPRHHFKPKKPKKSFTKRFALPVIALLIGLVCSYVVFGQNALTQSDNAPKEATTDIQVVSSSETKQKQLKKFTGEEFKQLYSSFAYPNTQPFTEPPIITGNDIADDRIRAIAEARGYKLSALPVSNIVKIDEPWVTDDDLIQPLAKIAWDDLKKAAKADKIPLQITSAYRSVEFQRSLFMRRIANEGITVFGIADGYSDAAVERVLVQAAIPGYSRHHTGFTIDIACDGIGLEAFKTTSCYSWLSANNFERAKMYGWVPSYPEEADQQGPEPEPWEFIWVGVNALYE